MILIDVATPTGALSPADRAVLVERTLSVTLDPNHAPEETMRRARAMTHVTFQERHDWFTGDGPLEADATPPIQVTVTVPEAWRIETSRHLTGVVRAAVNRIDADHGRTREVGSLWVNVVGIQDGSIGVDAKASTADQLLAVMTEDYRQAVREGREQPVPDGHLVDPICGMLVADHDRAIQLEHDGSRVGFCSTGCRDAYARERELDVV